MRDVNIVIMGIYAIFWYVLNHVNHDNIIIVINKNYRTYDNVMDIFWKQNIKK